MRLAWIALGLVGCLSPSGHQCADGRICADDATCDVDHGRCTTPDEIAACDGLADGAVCNLGALDTGHCDRGVCLRCGDGILNAGEVCDDGNLADRDGCSADCQSNETCGNGTIDRATGESCDDGNHIDHDGCSSTCQTEAPRWIQRPKSPPGRIYMGLAYDASRDRIVLVDGMTDREYFNDTWEWHGGWELPPPAPLLPGLIGATTTYDSLRHRTVVFGGVNLTSGVTSGGTFEWDGLTWQPGPDGPARYGHAMVYDSHRQKVVVFGGVANVDRDKETVELDSATRTWSVKTTATMPSTRGGVAMAYDPRRGVVVLFGGIASGTALGDTWEYDGTNWTAITPAGPSPSARSASAMAYDPTLQEVVLFGGATNVTATPFLADTWSWNGTRWAQITTATTPPASGSHALVATATNIYLFGGAATSTGAGAFAHTWRFDHTTWTSMDPPSSANGAVAVTDTRHGRVILVGGMAGGLPDETWELGRAGPHLLVHSMASDGPLVETDGALGYDPDRDQLVLFSGLIAGNTTPIWTWTGTSWATAAPTVLPTLRADAGIAWDPVGRTLLMFGGTDLTSGGMATPLNDTWRWTGTDWVAVPIADAPPARTRMAMATDPVRKQIVMFGGTPSALMNQPDPLTWIWNGTAWEGRDVSPAPPVGPNLFPKLAWNPARQKLVLLLSPLADLVQSWEWDGTKWEPITTLDPPSGGTTGPWATTAIDGTGVSLSISLNNGDTAELRWDAAPHDELCNGSDLDGDMLVSCADPDCWWACSPLCPPGTSCDASAPTCGDHHCDPTESCHTCPGDCGACSPVCGDFVCDANETCPGDCP